MVNKKNGEPKIRLAMFMVRFLVYIDNKPKTDDRCTFNDTIRLTESCLLLLQGAINRIMSKHP